MSVLNCKLYALLKQETIHFYFKLMQRKLKKILLWLRIDIEYGRSCMKYSLFFGERGEKKAMVASSEVNLTNFKIKIAKRSTRRLSMVIK